MRFAQRLLGRPARRYHVPPGIRVYAIGDVHGRADLLRPLLRWIREDNDRRGGDPQVHVVFLGDLIDRGPDSAGVLTMLADGHEPLGQRHVLRGNHEEMLLDILDGQLSQAGDWLDYGGTDTVQSYGIDPALCWRDRPAFAAALAEAIPAEHVAFLRATVSQVRIGDYLFVHAGIRPGVALDDQSTRDLRWIRGEFLDSRADHGMIVVHGHTVTPTVEFRPNRIGIDTGAYASGRLTALGLEGDARWTLTSRLD